MYTLVFLVAVFGLMGALLFVFHVKPKARDTNFWNDTIVTGFLQRGARRLPQAHQGAALEKWPFESFVVSQPVEMVGFMTRNLSVSTKLINAVRHQSISNALYANFTHRLARALPRFEVMFGAGFDDGLQLPELQGVAVYADDAAAFQRLCGGETGALLRELTTLGYVVACDGELIHVFRHGTPESVHEAMRVTHLLSVLAHDAWASGQAGHPPVTAAS